MTTPFDRNRRAPARPASQRPAAARPAPARPAPARPATPIRRPSPTLAAGRTAPPLGAPRPLGGAARPGAPAPGGKKIRILVTDDSAIMRRLVSEALRMDPTFDVVGTANNGKEALAQIERLKPDAMTLDIEMPVMNGLETLIPLRKAHPRLPVIMFSTLTERGAHATLEALRRGATDYATKPSATNLVEGRKAVIQELAPKIKAFAGHREEPPPSIKKAVATPPPRPRAATGRVQAVVIGVSTGGPTALGSLWKALPSNLPVPVLIVQHMPAAFTPQFAVQLDAYKTLPVVEASEGDRLEAGHGYLAPGGRHMVISKREGMHLELNDDAPENSCRPAVDVLFRSAASVYGGNVLGVMLTGMGYDGLLGSRDLVEAGGRLIAQDKETSVVWGMPGAVTEAGLTDAVLPLDRIASEIVNRVGGAARAGMRPLGGNPR